MRVYRYTGRKPLKVRVCGELANPLTADLIEELKHVGHSVSARKEGTFSSREARDLARLEVLRIKEAEAVICIESDHSRSDLGIAVGAGKPVVLLLLDAYHVSNAWLYHHPLVRVITWSIPNPLISDIAKIILSHLDDIREVTIPD